MQIVKWGSNSILSAVIALCFFVEIFQVQAQIKSDSIANRNSTIGVDYEVITIYIKPPLYEFSEATLDARPTYNAVAFNPSLSFRVFSPVGLATISFRGGSANGTSVLWEGMPLNSAANGQFDVNLLTGNSGNINLSTSEQIGNTLNGAVNINKAFFNDTNTNSIEFITGSYGLYSGQLKTERKLNKTLKIGLYANLLKVENNYDLVSDSQRRFGKQTHNAFQSAQGKLIIEKQFTVEKSLSAQYWYSNAYREIAPGVLSLQNRDTQADISHRLLLKFKLSESKGINVLAGNEQLNFYLSQADRMLPTRSSYLRTRVNLLQKEINSIWNIGIQNYVSIDKVENEGIGNRTDYLHQSTIRSVVNPIRRFWIYNQIGLINNAKRLKLEGLISAHYDLDKRSKYTLSASLERKYRFPTLNERFWQPGGNPDLNEEGITKFDFIAQGVFYKSNLTLNLYHYLTDNYIQWQPGASSFWEPRQYSQVISRGVELLHEWRGAPTNFKFNSFVTYNQSFISEKVNFLQSFSEKENVQLIFLPNWNVGNKAQYRLSKAFSISGEQQFYSARNLDFIGENKGKAILLFNSGIEYQQGISKKNATKVLLTLLINNLSNARYEWQPNFPMPGINGNITCRLIY